MRFLICVSWSLFGGGIAYAIQGYMDSAFYCLITAAILASTNALIKDMK